MDLPCASPKADRETAQHRSDLDRVDSVAKTADTTSRPAPPFTNPILGWVPGVGHFRRARVGHFWRAPRLFFDRVQAILNGKAGPYSPHHRNRDDLPLKGFVKCG